MSIKWNKLITIAFYYSKISFYYYGFNLLSIIYSNIPDLLPILWDKLKAMSFFALEDLPTSGQRVHGVPRFVLTPGFDFPFRGHIRQRCFPRFLAEADLSAGVADFAALGKAVDDISMRGDAGLHAWDNFFHQSNTGQATLPLR